MWGVAFLPFAHACSSFEDFQISPGRCFISPEGLNDESRLLSSTWYYDAEDGQANEICGAKCLARADCVAFEWHPPGYRSAGPNGRCELWKAKAYVTVADADLTPLVTCSRCLKDRVAAFGMNETRAPLSVGHKSKFSHK